MGFFDEKMTEKLKQVFSMMQKNVKVIYFTQEFECGICKDTRKFLEEVRSLNNKMELYIYDFESDKKEKEIYGVDKIPAIVIADENGDDTGIKFYGAPGGYEINSFIKAILETSGHREKISRKMIERIKKIDKPIHIQVFATLVCPYCPGAVMTAHRLALESENIKADMIDISLYPHLANKYSVSGVPKAVINEKYELIGAQPIDSFLDIIEKI